MNIDERLERLTQRHEALAQTVELLTKDLCDMKVLVHDIAEGTARLPAGRQLSKSNDRPIIASWHGTQKGH